MSDYSMDKYWDNDVHWSDKAGRDLEVSYNSTEIKGRAREDIAVNLVGLLFANTIISFIITAIISVITFGGQHEVGLIDLYIGLAIFIPIALLLIGGSEILLRLNIIKEGIFSYSSSPKNIKYFKTDDSLTRKQVEQIAEELNTFKANDNRVEYEKILNKVMDKDDEIQSTIRKNNEKLRLERDKKNLIEKMDNPYLNESYYTIKLGALTEEFINLNKESELSESEVEKFRGLLVEVNALIEGELAKDAKNKIALDCQKELIEVTRKYNDIMARGGRLNSEEFNSYKSLLMTCENLLKVNVTKELTGELVNSAEVSNIYLKDKYSYISK